jgi:hypothetical protein
MDRGVVQVTLCGVPRRLLPPGFLVAELPAVLDLRQNLANSLNILIAPKADSNTTDPNKWRKRNLLGRDVAVQRSETESKLPSRIA